MVTPLTAFVRRHDHPVGRGEFRVIAVTILALAIGIALSSAYAYLGTSRRVCATTGACEAVAAPSMRDPMQPPASRDTIPWRLGAEPRSGRRPVGHDW